MEELEENLLIEILAQLPVKSLIRFTCVCKYWHSIITSYEFASKHYATRLKFNRNSDSNNTEGYDHILSEFSPACSLSITSYQNLQLETTFKFRPAVEYEPAKFGVNHRDIIHCETIYGPCNGVFLLEIRKCDAYGKLWLLWNPAIRDVFRVPLEGIMDWNSCHGFGFDHVTNDYKIVCFDFNGFVDRRSDVYLYSLAANSCRCLDRVGFDDIGFGGVVQRCYSSYCSNGSKYHWIISENDDSNIKFKFLLSFDVVDEVFVQTLLPDDESHYHYEFLGHGSNNVYPTVYSVLDSEIHIWSLNEYGPRGTWSKLKSFTIPTMVEVNNPMVFWKNKAIVFASHGDQPAMTRCDLATGEMTSLHFPADNTILAYTESLFSVAKFIQQPSPDFSSVAEMVQAYQQGYNSHLRQMALLYQRRQQHKLWTEEQPEEEDDSLLEEEFQQLVQEHYARVGDDDDSSSTDSAFLMPVAPVVDKGGNDDSEIFVDYDTHLKFIFYRLNERQRLCQLPYCLREVNQPLISNPYTF